MLGNDLGGLAGTLLLVLVAALQAATALVPEDKTVLSLRSLALNRCSVNHP